MVLTPVIQHALLEQSDTTGITPFISIKPVKLKSETMRKQTDMTANLKTYLNKSALPH